MKKSLAFASVAIAALTWISWPNSPSPVTPRAVLSNANVLAHEHNEAPETKAHPNPGNLGEVAPIPPAPVVTSLAELKQDLRELSDHDLEGVAAEANQELQKRIQADPSGKHRNAQASAAIALALNRKAAAQLLLIDRHLDAARRKLPRRFQ